MRQKRVSFWPHVGDALGRTALVGFCVAMSTRNVTAQKRDSSGTAHVRIIGIFDGKTGDPVAGVQVRDSFSGDFALSTITGTVALSFVTFRGDAAVVELRKLGYAPMQLFLTRGDEAPLTEIMEPVPMLAPVLTTEKYRLDRDAGLREGFDVRCAAKNITCVRDSTLLAHPLVNMADLLLTAPGITIGSCASDGRATAKREAHSVAAWRCIR